MCVWGVCVRVGGGGVYISTCVNERRKHGKEKGREGGERELVIRVKGEREGGRRTCKHASLRLRI